MRMTNDRRGARLNGYRLGGMVTAVMVASLSQLAEAQEMAKLPASQTTEDSTGAQAAKARGVQGDIVVTARRRAETVQSTPLSITALSGEMLKDRSVVQITDLTKTSPGVNIVPSHVAPLSAIFVIRGQSQRDPVTALESPIGIYSDGVYLNSAVGVLATSFVDVARVEVLKGAQGTLYGRNTTGGAINFYTNQPIDKWEGSLTAGIGTYGNYQASGVINIPLGSDVALRAVGEARRDGGYGRDLVSGSRTGDRESRVFRAAMRLQPTSSVVITLRGDYSDVSSDGGSVLIPLALNPASNAARAIALSQGYITRAQLTAQGNNLNAAQRQQALDYYNGFLNDGPRNIGYRASYGTNPRGDVEAWGLSATAEWNIGAVQLKSITAYRRLDDSKFLDIDAIPEQIFTLEPFTSAYEQVTQEVQFNGNAIGDRLHFALGGYYYYRKGRDMNTSFNVPAVLAATPSFVDSTVRVSSPAFYGQATFDITPELHVTGGLRYTWESRTLDARNTAGPTGAICTLPPPAGVAGAPCRGNYRFDDQDLSYLAGADWQATPNIMVYVRTGRGFKSGGVNQRLTTNPVSATPFQSETVTDYEAGVKSDLFDRRLRLNIAAYRSNYNDIQRSVQVLDSLGRAVGVIDNAARAVIQGLEVETTARLTDRFTLQGTLGYTDAHYIRYINPANGVDLSGQEFDSTPKWSYTISAAYEHPTSFGSVSARADWAYIGARNLFPAGAVPSINRQPGYGVLDGQIRVSLGEPDIDIRLFVQNLLDRRYLVAEFDAFVAIGTLSGVVGAPRTGGLSVSKRF